MSGGQQRLLTLDEAIEFHHRWSDADRDIARRVIGWAVQTDPRGTAYSPPAGEVAVFATSDGGRLVTMRQGYIRFHTSQRPPFDGVEPGSIPGTWSLALSRRRAK